MTGRYDLCSTIQETDGNPSNTGCGLLNVSNGSLTDNGDGTFTLSGGAPLNATYITQTSNATLSAEQALSGLSSGLMRVANGTGVITSLTDSAGLATNLSDETGSGVAVFGTSPTFTTSLIDPKIIGGSGTTQTLTLQTTSGVGASGADMIFDVGNNGGTESMRILNNGKVGIGQTNPLTPLHIKTSTAIDGEIIENTNAAGGLSALLELYNNSSSPTIGDLVGGIRFTGIDSASNTRQLYAQIDGDIKDTTSGSEDGYISFSVERASTLTEVMNVFASANASGDQGFTVNDGSTAWIDARMEGDTMAYLFFLDSSADKIGINESAPGNLLQVTGVDNTNIVQIKDPVAQASVTALDCYMIFTSTTGTEASICGTASAGVIAYNTFTGSHYTQIVDKTGLLPGMLLEAIDEPMDTPVSRTLHLKKWDRDKNGVLTNTMLDDDVTYQASPKPQLFKSRICRTKGSKAAIGVYGGTNNEGEDTILALGTGQIIVANKGQDISLGDYLMSSDISGLAEKQPDDIYRNSTVAKTTQSIRWLPGEESRVIRCIYEGG